MKTILTYEFEENERESLLRVVEGERWKDVVWHLDQNVLRRVIKYGDISAEKVAHYSELRDELHRLINELGLQL